MAMEYDVIVVGAGNAALAAANSAKENGAERIVVLEKASEKDRGGNTHYSGGLLRIAFDESRDLEPLVPGVEEKLENFYDNVEPYTKDDFWADLLRVTAGKTDRELASVVIDNSYDTIRWMHEYAGIPMEPAVSLAGIKVGNEIKFQKGAVIRARQEGVGLSRAWVGTFSRCIWFAWERVFPGC